MNRFLALIFLLPLLSLALAYGEGVRLTYYGEAFAGQPMYCSGRIFHPDDPTVVATGQQTYVCGDTLEVCGTSCVQVVVRDKCPVCHAGHVDLSRAAWEAAGSVDYGTVRKVGGGNTPDPPVVTQEGTEVVQLPQTGMVRE